MKTNNTRQSRASEGYNMAKELMNNAKNIPELITAVKQSMRIINEYGIDEYHQELLENYGRKCYDRMEMVLKNYQSNLQHNKRIAFSNNGSGL